MGNKKQDVIDKLAFLLAVACYACLVFYLCIAYAGNGSLHIKTLSQKSAKTIFPENWSVFTRSPGEPILKLYQLQDGKLVHTELRSFSPTFDFGLNRKNRVTVVEMKLLLGELAKDSTLIKYPKATRTPYSIDTLLRADTLRYNNLSTKNIHLLEGKIVISVEDFVAWPQRKEQYKKPHTATFIPVNIIRQQ